MHERPFAISAVCVLGALAACYTAVLLLNTGMWAVPPTTSERAVALGAVAIAVAALYGMWRMRRWGCSYWLPRSWRESRTHLLPIST